MSNVNDDLAKKVLALFDYLKRIRQPFEGIWQDVADHVVPIREDVTQTLPQGQRQGTKIYDGSALIALQNFANGLYGYLVSPSILWFRLTLDVPVNMLMQQYHRGAMTRGPSAPYISRYESLEDVPEVRSWLQDTGIALYRSFQRSRSFYPEMLPFFADGGSIGTSTIYSEEDIGGKRTVYRTMHPGQIWISENRYGDVDTVFCLERLEATKAEEMFGEHQLSDAVKTALKNNPFQRFKFLHAVYPNKDWNPAKIGKLSKRFASVWVDIDAQKIMDVGGYGNLPYHVWRYWKDATETYGRSPGMFALYDIMALNKIGKTMLGAARLAVEPAYNVPAELEGKWDVKPHGANYYGDDPKRVVFPVRTDITYPIGTDREERKSRIIDRHFHIDFFLMLQQAQRQMTATEALERQGERAILLGGAIGNYCDKTMDPLIDRQFELEYRARRLPLIPAIMQDYGGERIGIDYLGPLAQAQKRLFRTQGITQGLIALQPFLPMFPQIMDKIDSDEVADEVLEAYNFPQRAIRTPEAVEAIRKARAQAQQVQDMKAQIAMATDQLKTVAEADQASGGRIGDAIAQSGGIELPAGNA